jgi:hypothetical protein
VDQFRRKRRRCDFQHEKLEYHIDQLVDFVWMINVFLGDLQPTTIFQNQIKGHQDRPLYMDLHSLDNHLILQSY